MSNALDQSPAHKYAGSHWYRVAYPDTDNRPMTRLERVAIMLAEHYDSLASQCINPSNSFVQLNEGLSQYHNLYTLWRDNDFSPIMFASMTNSIRSTMSFPV